MIRQADFECSRCATCCRNLVEESSGIQRGLPLTSEEKELFSPENVAPKLGIGVESPKNVVLFQLTTNCCPHLNHQNHCGIYSKRPLMCRSFPIVAGAISNRCKIFSYRKPGVPYQETYKMTQQVEASNRLEKYIEKQLMKHLAKGVKLWEFDLKKKSWIDLGPI